MKKLFNKYWPQLTILLFVLLAFYPSILFKKIPLNGNNLVSFFSPWVYQEFDGYPAGVPSKPGVLDQLRIYYPYMNLTQQSYRLGQIPLWNPYNFAGNPHMAEWQSGVFYPLHILLPFLPLPIYWTFYQMMGFFLSGLFTYLYLRNLKVNKLGSLFSGLTYSLSTFMFTWNAEVVPTSHSILWLPLMLLLVDKFLVKARWKYWLILLFSGVFSILSGYWQTTFYVLVLVGIYALVRFFFLPPPGQKKPPSKKSLLILLSAFPLMATLTAYHLIPTWELYGRSSRGIVNLRPDLQEFIKGYLLKGQRLVTLLIPDFFGHPTTRNNFSLENGTYYEWALFVGTLPIIMLPTLKLIKSKVTKKFLWFLFIVALTTGALSFDLPFSRWVYDAQVPVLSTGIANRILFIPAFVLSIFAGFALDAWIKSSLSERRKATKSALILGSIAFGLVWIFLFRVAPNLSVSSRYLSDWVRVSSRNTVIPTAMFILGGLLLFLGSLKKKWVIPAAVLLIAGSSLQNVYQFNKFTPFTPKEFIYPRHQTIKFLQENAGVNRFIGYNGVYMNNNFATQFNIFSIEGYDSLNDIRRSMLIFSAEHDGKLTDQLTRSADASLARQLENPSVLKMMQLAGIKYLVDHSEYLDATNKDSLPTLPPQKQSLVFEDGDWKIYEYKDALPRAFLVGDYIVEANDQKTADLIFNNSTDLSKTVILNQEPISVAPEPDPSAEVSIVSYTPNKITFETDSEKDQLLFLSDTFYPGWRAKIDGASPQDVLAANFAFRGVEVPAGKHIVEMFYMPDSFTNGLKVALGSLLLILFGIKTIKLDKLKN